LAQECVVRHAAGKGEIAHHGWPSHEKYENWKKTLKYQIQYVHIFVIYWHCFGWIVTVTVRKSCKKLQTDAETWVRA